MGGFVKGGIRLSFSKHPLGQRGPAPSNLTTSFANASNGASSSPTSILNPSSASALSYTNPLTSPPLSSPVTFTFSSPTSSGGGRPTGSHTPSSRNIHQSQQQQHQSQHQQQLHNSNRHSPPSTDYLSSSSLSQSVETSSGTSLSTSPPSVLSAPVNSTSVQPHEWKSPSTAANTKEPSTFSPFAKEIEG